MCRSCAELLDSEKEKHALNDNKQISDEVSVISRIIKVEVKGYRPKPKAEADNPY